MCPGMCNSINTLDLSNCISSDEQNSCGIDHGREPQFTPGYVKQRHYVLGGFGLALHAPMVAFGLRPGRLVAIKEYIDTLKTGSGFPSYIAIKQHVIARFGWDAFTSYKEQIQVFGMCLLHTLACTRKRSHPGGVTRCFTVQRVGDAECTATKPTSSCKVSARRATAVVHGSGHKQSCLCMRAYLYRNSYLCIALTIVSIYA